MRHLSWQIRLVNGLVISGMLLGWIDSAGAQRRPIADETLGNENSRVVPLDPEALVDRIEGGAQRGDNLFHSFREFHVDEGRGVYFADPGVENILSRVTGGVESQILGVLGVLGDANLFLINPSGIIFGPNARLDVSGSFFATTADALQFGEQGFFSASDPNAPPLLTVQPSAFLFNQLNPETIANNSTAPAAENPSGLPEFGLKVPAGESLTLLGGNISLDGGGLVALGGRVEVGGLSQPGTVTLNADGSLGFPIGVARSDVMLTNRSRINVVGDSGSITVNAGALEIVDSGLSAGIGSNAGFVGAQAGDITLNAIDIRSRDRVSIANLVRDGGVGNSGDIRITTGSFSLTNVAQLQTTTFGRGNAGNVIIRARDRIALDNVDILSTVGDPGSDALAVGNGGDIRIDTGSLSLNNDVQLVAGSVGQGNAGNIIINARNRVILDNNSVILSPVGDVNLDATAEGNGGNIRIDTGSLFLNNGAQLFTSTFGQGNAGNIIINARNRVILDNNSVIFSPVGDASLNALAGGNGGDIRIDTGSLSLNNGAQLAASTFGRGNAGNIIINAREQVSLDGVNPINPGLPFPSGIFSTVGAANENRVAYGNGGDIRIDTGSLSLTNGAQLVAGTRGQGNAGNVIINARDRVSLEGGSREGLSGIFTSTLASAQGRGGDVHIAADSVRLAGRAVITADTESRFSGGTVTLNANTFEATQGGQVITTTSGGGQAGNITFNVADRIILSGFGPGDDDGGEGVSNQRQTSGLFANTAENSSGRGGTIRMTTGELEVSDRAGVVVNSEGSGVAGDIDVSAQSVQLDRGRLEAETDARADGGNITLGDTDLLLLRNGSNISTSAGTDETAESGGNGGNITIDADLIVAFPDEDSDIRANAFTGSGGNVEITTEGLFGIAAQPQDNPLTSDITASSEQGVQGTVNITPPDVDPRRGLSELPVTVVDASDQITRTCPGLGGRGEAGEFVVTGRGGLPPSPIDPLIGEESLADWAVLEGEEGAEASPSVPSNPEGMAAAGAIVEAQGWVVGEDGNVQLIAAAPASSTPPPAICQSSENP